MKRILVKKPIALFVLFYCHLLIANCQSNYWQQEVNYTIEVSLNDKDNTLTGFERIEYINNSPETLKFIWFHLWPNAYKNDKTAFSDQLLENGNTKFYFSDKEQKGYINRLDFKVNNTTAQTEDHPQHIDIVKIILPSALSPGQKILITTPFHVKLPYNFSRGGHDGQSYQVTQWYPKPAVYDSKGWHPMPYLDQGEFYSEFGSFDVSITVPSNYVVAATGELQNTEEKEWLKSRSSFKWEPIKRKEKTKGGIIKTVTEQFPSSANDIKILHYKQSNVHDFAWFADKRFIVNSDTCQLRSGKIINVFAYYTPAYSETWKQSVKYAKDAIHHYSDLVGEYPYSVVSVVQGPESFGGGMEYPTITVISPTSSKKELDATIAHELGHNWFYGILASNERDHPWMDEGINTFFDRKYYEKKYGLYPPGERIGFETKAVTKTDQPINTTSEKFSAVNYDLVAYYKAGDWLRYMESELGAGIFDKAMHEYYRRWQFKHPQPEDFKKTIEDINGRNADSLFTYLDKKGILPNEQRTGTKVGFFLDPKFYKDYVRSSYKNVLLYGPSIGINAYDKLMIGGLLTNIKLPPSNFTFFIAPMYSIGAKKFTGIGFVNQRFYSDGTFKKIDIGINASTFSYDEFPKMDGSTINYSFYKFSPVLRLTFKEKDARSTMNKFIQWRTYFIKEENYGKITYDTIINTPDTAIRQNVATKTENSVINQLKFVIENNRVLYPYRGELKIEQGKDFIRAAFTGKYFFNYSKGGGLDVRLFAGKFIFSSSRTDVKSFATDRYHLNMTGANGYEDYTYSDYFIGRNKFKGAASQQIMIRDGAFKVRTDLLNDKVGKTDDWLIAANFTTTIPPEINPLNILPIKIPLKIFADVGTYAEPWKKNSELDRFLFDAGVYIPFFKETINIYIPLLYSKVFKDYIQSSILPKKGRFFKVISFSIDISNFSFRKFDRNFAF